jgi:hypothetical protein
MTVERHIFAGLKFRVFSVNHLFTESKFRDGAWGH